MDQSLFRYDERYTKPHRKTNFFAWTVTLLLLSGFTLTAWLGTFYIFGQPERPDSYRILQKLQKIDPPKRFELTAAPGGEFLNPKQIYERYIALRPAELAKKNAELTRNYIRNYQSVAGLVPYVVGRFEILEARDLGQQDVFTTGVVALTRASERGELLMEHLYPGNPQDVPLMKQTLTTGLEIRLERTHDLSAILQANRLPDGRLLITTVPLLYGSYTVTRGTATFSLEPPNELNLIAGWPLFKEPLLRTAEARYDRFRQGLPMETPTPAIAAAAPESAAAPTSDGFARAAPAEAPELDKVAGSPAKVQSPASTPVVLAKNERPAPYPGTMNNPNNAVATAPAPGSAPTIAPSVAPALPPATVARATPPASTPAAIPTRTTPPRAEPADAPAMTETDSAPRVDAPQVLPAIPVPEGNGNSLASTAGGGRWRTFEPGKMPAGRLIAPNDLKEVADRGTAGERYYLRGQFVVNFVDANRAVLRTRGRLTDSVMRLAGGGNSTRIIVDFPAGHPLPTQGTVISRDELRPFEITEIRKQSDGQINVFAREIVQP